MADEEFEMGPLDASTHDGYDAIHTPSGPHHPRQRSFGASRHQQQQRDQQRSQPYGGGNDNRHSYHYQQTTPEFGRIANGFRHRRDYGDDDGVGDFNFGDDSEVRRDQERRRNGGMHRLDNDRGHSSSTFASGYTISNSSNGGGEQSKYVKLRPSGMAITPGASFAVSEAQRLDKKYVPPPAVEASFITNLMKVSKSGAKSRSVVTTRPFAMSASTTTTTASTTTTAASSTSSVFSASPTRVRMKPTTSLLEAGSAPSPSRIIRTGASSSHNNAGAVRVPVPAPSLGWTSARGKNAAVAVQTQQKPRILLTPAKRRFLELAPTRTSPRQPLLRPGSTISSSYRTRESRIDTGGSDDETSNNTNSNRTSISIGDTSSSISSLVKRNSRLRAKIQKKTDGTADKPIDLDSDSDAESPAKKAAKQAVQPPRKARTKAKRRAPTRIEPHWKDVDLATISNGCLTEFTDMVVWIGRLQCKAHVFLWEDCVWVSSITSEVVKWNLMPHLQLFLKDFKGVYLYRYSDDKAPIVASEKSDAAESLMAKNSFVAFRATCSSEADQKVLKPFYDPDGPDDSKHYFVVEAPEYDHHGMCFDSMEERIKQKHESLVNVIEDMDAGRAYLQALLREPRYVGGSTSDDNQKRSASDYRSDASEEEIEEDEEDDSDCFDVQLTYPLPPCSSDIVTITCHDVSRLKPKQYLNDNIIDYYFKRLMVEEYVNIEYIQKNVLFLSSHFYSRLRMGKGATIAARLKAGYKNVATWVARTDFFSRNLIFIPINKDMHWSLAIILNPSSAAIESPTKKQPPTCIVVLDPLGSYHSKPAIVRNLKSFLQLEWENSHAAKHNGAATGTTASGDDIALSSSSLSASPGSNYDVEKVLFVSVKAPRQQNSFDCGVYVLKFADVIINNYVNAKELFDDSGPISKETIDDKLQDLITAKAFAPDDITSKRTEIQDFIRTDTHKYHESVHTLAAEQKKKVEPTIADGAVNATQVEDAEAELVSDSTGEAAEASN